MNQLVGPTGRDRGFCESGGGGCGVVPFELDTNQRQQSDESNNTALPSPGRFTKTQQVPTGSTGSTGVLQDPVTRDPVPEKQGDDRVHHRAALENVRPTAAPGPGDRLRRLAVFADHVPQVQQVAVALDVDKVATLLGMVVDVPESDR